MAKWLKLGTKVKHRLTGWEGYVVGGMESHLTNLASEVPLNEVTFYNTEKNELVRHSVISEELEILEGKEG